MAPVSDQAHREEGAPLRLRRRRAVWRRRPRGGDDDERRGRDDSDRNQRDDRGDSDSEDEDHAPPRGQGGSGVSSVPVPLTTPQVATVGLVSTIAASPSSQPPQLARTTTQPLSSSTLSTLTIPKPTPSTTLTPLAAPSTLALPTLSANNPVAVNPQVGVSSAVTTPSIFIMTTTPIATLSTTSSSTASFIPSLFPSVATTTVSSAPTPAFDLDFPSPTIFLSDTDKDHDGDSRDNSFSGPPPGGLSPTGEDVLISAGSIGAFILICFICWIGWRMYKRSKGGMDMRDDSHPNALLARIPYFGRNQRAWNDLGDGPNLGGPQSIYDQASVKSMGTKVSMYSMADSRYTAQPPARQASMGLPQLDTNVTYANVNPFSASSQGSGMNSSSAYSSNSGTMQSAAYLQHQQQPMGLPQLKTTFGSGTMSNDPFASPEDVLGSPSSARNYGNGTAQTFETTTTDRSRMPDPYFNQSELARQASTAFDPAQRAVYRASELSSISSGFGDGDFIVPPPAVAQQGARPYSYAKTNVSRAVSVANRSEVGSAGQRDTVYTTTSEDMPARYRSVNSWVNQQTGRVQRQHERDSNEEVPPVPSLPPEQRLTMMMDDGEEPRRFEDTLGSQPPVPALPAQHAGAQDTNNSIAKP